MIRLNRMILIGALVCTLLTIMLFHVGQSASSNKLPFKITHHNKCLKSDLVLDYFLKISLKQCVRRCAVRPACQSINYRRHHLLCELYLEKDGEFIENSGKSGSCVFVGRPPMDFQMPLTCSCKYMDTCDVKSKTCERKECHKLMVDHGVVVGNLNTIGSKVEVSCNDATYGHTLGKQATCEEEGQWSYIPTCIRKCPEILTLDDGVINTTQRSPGSEMTFACNENYTEVQNRTHAACLYTGEWSYAPRCELILCPELTLNNGVIEGLLNNINGVNLQTPDTQVRFLCNEGYKEVENMTRAICDLAGQWSYVPTCITVTCSTTAELSYFKDNYENIALHKTVTMKDIYHETSEALMVDGNLNANHPHCSHAFTAQNSFAVIDLGQSYTIYAVYIVNRQDCCAERLRDVRITIGDNMDNLKLFVHHTPAIGRDCIFNMTQPCKGRYLRIVNTDLAVLTICELEVYGSLTIE